MSYKIEISDSVYDDLKKIPRNVRDCILRAIKTRLVVCPYGLGKPLRGKWKGCYRLRIGTYRVIYEVDDFIMTVLVIRINTRKDVYS
jgi:mRNA interferase RelE/StbE